MRINPTLIFRSLYGVGGEISFQVFRQRLRSLKNCQFSLSSISIFENQGWIKKIPVSIPKKSVLQHQHRSIDIKVIDTKVLILENLCQAGYLYYLFNTFLNTENPKSDEGQKTMLRLL